MKIGRKIYYEKSTGNFVLETGEKQGDVFNTTKEHDFSVYPDLIGKNIIDYDFIQLQYGERASEFSNIGSLKINIETKELIIYSRLKITADKTQIQPNGIDTAIINSDYVDYYSINGEGNYSVNPMEFCSNIPGSYEIKAYSDLYGENSIMIEVV